MKKARQNFKNISYIVALTLVSFSYTGCNGDDKNENTDNPKSFLSSPFIEFTAIENEVSGRIENPQSNAAIVIYALTDRYYVQPFANNPYTEIAPDGSWSSFTHPWVRLVALLVDKNTFSPPTILDAHPRTLPGVISYAETPAERVLTFPANKYDWIVKLGINRDPGPNSFAQEETNVRLDEEGLHLYMHKHNNEWLSSEVVLAESLGYGTYQFTFSIPSHQLGSQTIFAGFLYDIISQQEIDIEFSTALASPDNAQFVLQPYDHPGNIFRFSFNMDDITSHQIEWHPEYIEFVSWQGDDNAPTPETTIASWIYYGSDIPDSQNLRMRFNLWIFGGIPTLDKTEEEVIIHDFSYQPF